MVAFEIAEIVALVALIVYTAIKKQFAGTLVFALALLEHARQVVLCTRQAARGPRNWLTLANYLLVISLAISRQWWVVASAMTIGIIIHTAVIVTNRPFSDIVCARAS